MMKWMTSVYLMQETLCLTQCIGTKLYACLQAEL